MGDAQRKLSLFPLINSVVTNPLFMGATEQAKTVCNYCVTLHFFLRRRFFLIPLFYKQLEKKWLQSV